MLIGTLCRSDSARIPDVAACGASHGRRCPGDTRIRLLCCLPARILGLVSITGLNFYGASLTLLSVADCVTGHRSRWHQSRRIMHAAGGRLRCVSLATRAGVSSRDFANRFEDLLSVLLYLFTPWTAINLVDFYWVRKCRYSVREIFNPHGIYGRWSWRGLVAYGARICGHGAVLQHRACTVGPVARGAGRCRPGDAGRSAGLIDRLPLIACRSLDIRTRMGGGGRWPISDLESAAALTLQP